MQGRLGLIPQEAADEIVSHCKIEQIDMALLRQQTERIGYPILGVVSQLNKLCRDKPGEYSQRDATTATHRPRGRARSREHLAAMCDPANCLGQSGVMVDRVLAQMPQ